MTKDELCESLVAEVDRNPHDSMSADVRIVFKSAYEAGEQSASREAMRMIVRQKLCHDDEFLLLSAIREKFAVEI